MAMLSAILAILSPGWSTILSIESRVLKYMMEYMKTSDFRSPTG
jgi:hypothetical protein